MISLKPASLPDISVDIDFVKFTVGQVTFFCVPELYKSVGVHDLADLGYLVSDGGKGLRSKLTSQDERNKKTKKRKV